MGLRLLFLLLTISLSSSFTSAATVPFDQLRIYMDASGCTNLQCEWKGFGNQCTFVSTLEIKKLGFFSELLEDGESEEAFLKRLKKLHPLNKFTIVNSFEMDEMCTWKMLACDAFQLLHGEEGHEEFFERLNPRTEPSRRTKLDC